MWKEVSLNQKVKRCKKCACFLFHVLLSVIDSHNYTACLSDYVFSVLASLPQFLQCGPKHFISEGPNIQLQPQRTSEHKLPELLSMCCHEPARFSTSCLYQCILAFFGD